MYKIVVVVLYEQLPAQTDRLAAKSITIPTTGAIPSYTPFSHNCSTVTSDRVRKLTEQLQPSVVKLNHILSALVSPNLSLRGVDCAKRCRFKTAVKYSL